AQLDKWFAAASPAPQVHTAAFAGASTTETTRVNVIFSRGVTGGMTVSSVGTSVDVEAEAGADAAGVDAEDGAGGATGVSADAEAD
ncbi:MAG: hypothetical protein RSE27_01110, partial [Ruthenibacterium sp.]